jgi:hypothetical protein
VIAGRVPYVFPTRQIEGQITRRSSTIEPLVEPKSLQIGPHNPTRSNLVLPRLAKMNDGVWETVSGDAGAGADSKQAKGPSLRAFLEAAEGTRTLDLLHGKQTL